MLAFAFMNPQSIRLLLDRSRYEGIVLPPVGLKADSVVKVYTEALEVKRQSTPVFIYPDVPTLTTVVRSGALDVTTGKHILCASVSVLARHGVDALDASANDAMWRVRANLSSIMNNALAKDNGIQDETIDRLVSAPELPEQKFSNPIVKVDEKPCVDFSEIANMLGSHDQKREILVALLRYLTWGYVAQHAAALGGTALEITRAAVGKLLVANNKAFAADVKARGLRIPVTVLARARTMFKTSAPASIINFAIKRFGSKRPYSLAVAESGCLSSNAALVELAGLKLEDFPRPAQASVAPVRVASHNMAGLTTIVEPGTYSFTQIMHLIGEHVEHAFDVVRRTNSRIVFNRNPSWQDNDNCWSIDTGNDFFMVFDGIKYRFCTADSAQPVPENKVTLDSPKVVIRRPAAAPAPAPAASRKNSKAAPAPAPKPAAARCVESKQPARKALQAPASTPAPTTKAVARPKRTEPVPAPAPVPVRKRTAAAPAPAPAPVKRGAAAPAPARAGNVKAAKPPRR